MRTSQVTPFFTRNMRVRALRGIQTHDLQPHAQLPCHPTYTTHLTIQGMQSFCINSWGPFISVGNTNWDKRRLILQIGIRGFEGFTPLSVPPFIRVGITNRDKRPSTLLSWLVWGRRRDLFIPVTVSNRDKRPLRVIFFHQPLQLG